MVYLLVNILSIQPLRVFCFQFEMKLEVVQDSGGFHLPVRNDH